MKARALLDEYRMKASKPRGMLYRRSGFSDLLYHNTVYKRVVSYKLNCWLYISDTTVLYTKCIVSLIQFPQGFFPCSIGLFSFSVLDLNVSTLNQLSEVECAWSYGRCDCAHLGVRRAIPHVIRSALPSLIISYQEIVFSREYAHSKQCHIFVPFSITQAITTTTTYIRGATAA